MIPSATLPSSALSLLSKEPSAEGGEGLPAESLFSALLDAKIGLELEVTANLHAPEVLAAAPAETAITPFVVKTTGKPDGNILPDLPRLAGLGLGEALVPLDEPAQADAPADSAAPSDDQLAAQAIATEVTFAVLPTITAAFTANQPVQTLPGVLAEAEPPRPPKARPAIEIALPAGRQPGPLPTLAAAQPALAAEAPPAQVSPIPAAASLPIALSGIPQVAQTARQVAVKTAIVMPLTVATETEPPAAERAAAAPIAPQPVAAAISLRANPARRELGPEEATKPAANLAKEAARPHIAGQAAPAPAAPEPAALLAPLQTGAPTTVASPAISPLSGQHDFAALIDRLVEARQAAQTSLSAQTVTAAISHAEFGQVSLQFRHDGDGLSVVMAGADPDLARAIQIAAPAAATSAQAGGNSEGVPPRQDSSSQQAATNQSPAQQQRSGSSQRPADEARNSANPSPRQRGQDEPDQRSGIFA